MAEDKEEKWYVVKTRAKQERVVQQQINRFGVETFLPTRIEVRDWHDRKKKVESVLIPNTVFLKAEKNVAIDLHNVQGIQFSFLRDVTSLQRNQLLVIPDRQMKEFMRFLKISDNQFEVEPDATFMRGDKVIITQGCFKGITGELVKINGKDKVIVRLNTIISCSVPTSMDCLEKINGLI